MAIPGYSSKACDEECVPMLALPDDIVKQHLKERRIFLNGEVDQQVVTNIVMHIERLNFEDEAAEATQLNHQRQPILLYINSPGGYCDHGLAVVSAIEQSATPIFTIAMGIVASMGLLIFVSGHVRYSYRHARFLCHQHSSGVIGHHQTQLEHVEEGAELQQRLDGILLARTRITRKQLERAQQRKHDWTFYPEKALELGVVDDILPQVLRVSRTRKSSANK